ncbi:MAG: TorF family putative porin [Pseudomonadota bacterium]
MNKKITGLLGSAAIAASVLTIPATSLADELSITGNAGILSDYIYRGIPQNDSSGNGGIDLGFGGFYLGTWLAQVNPGIEYDIYAGYIFEFDNGMYVGGGYTTYQYSDNFDAEYNEFNLYAGGSANDVSLDLEFSFGEYNGEFLDDNGNTEGDNYNYFAATLGYSGAYLTYGRFDDDAKDDLGQNVEVGYTMELAGFELTGAVVHTWDANILEGLDGNDDDEETEAYVSISWGWDIL